MTQSRLGREIPRLEPDDEFVDRLAQLAAASRPTRGGVVVPSAFGGPATRTVAVAAAVAAITAGAAVTATHLPHPEDTSPTAPITSVGSPTPSAGADRHQDRRRALDQPVDAVQDAAPYASGPDARETHPARPGRSGRSPWNDAWQGHWPGHHRGHADDHGHDPSADQWNGGHGYPGDHPGTPRPHDDYNDDDHDADDTSQRPAPPDGDSGGPGDTGFDQGGFSH